MQNAYHICPWSSATQPDNLINLDSNELGKQKEKNRFWRYDISSRNTSLGCLRHSSPFTAKALDTKAD